MFNFLIPICIFYIVSYFCYQIIALFVQRKERLALINRALEVEHAASSRALQELMTLLTKRSQSFNWLRIGFVLIGVGIGVVAGMVMTPLFTDCLSTLLEGTRMLNEGVSLCWLSMAAIFGGISLILSYVLESKIIKKEMK